MPDGPVLGVLCRRGDLSLVRTTQVTVALLRDEDSAPAHVAASFDRAEWDWIRVCAAPLALQVLGPEPDERLPVGGRTALPVDAA